MRQNVLNELIAFDLKKQFGAVTAEWDKSEAIFIRYVGEEETATAEVAASTLVLCAPALTTIETINLAAANRDTLAELVAHINGLADWECTLGDQFDGSEVSADLAVSGEAIDVNTDDPVAFAHDSNLKILLPLPAPGANQELVVMNIVGNTTYGSGNSRLRFYLDDVLAWEEAGEATTVEKEATLDRFTVPAGSTGELRIENSEAMTAGYLSASYYLKSTGPFTLGD